MEGNISGYLQKKFGLLFARQYFRRRKKFASAAVYENSGTLCSV
jgi:hypothetical protein